jgi:hypothetical protein
VVYLGSAFLAFLSDLSECRMNNLRVFSGLVGSNPTRASNIPFHLAQIDSRMERSCVAGNVAVIWEPFAQRILVRCGRLVCSASQGFTHIRPVEAHNGQRLAVVLSSAPAFFMDSAGSDLQSLRQLSRRQNVFRFHGVLSTMLL